LSVIISEVKWFTCRSWSVLSHVWWKVHSSCTARQQVEGSFNSSLHLCTNV